MSENKNRYYEVTTTTVVSARNMTDAATIARTRRGVNGGKFLSQDQRIERVSARIAQRSMEA